MRHLPTLLLLSVTVAPWTASADTHFVRGSQVLSVPSAYATPASPYHGRFLELREKVDKQTQASRFAFDENITRIRYFQGEKPVDIVLGDGCGKHPIEWLYKARGVGWFSRKSPALLLIQVPEDAKIVAAPNAIPACAEAGQVLASTVMRTASEQLAYVVCSGDRNARLVVMRLSDQGTWTRIDAFTVTDNCP
jgi:hypothetical protein